MQLLPWNYFNANHQMLKTITGWSFKSVADPDLQIRVRGGGGDGSSTLWDKEGAWSQKKFFRPFGPHFGLRIRGGGGKEGGHGPLPWICHCKWSSVYPNCYDKLLCQSVLKHLPNFLTENQYFYANKVKIKGPTKPSHHKPHTQMFFWLLMQWNVWQSP